jgi:HK97 family phage prohead protease
MAVKPHIQKHARRVLHVADARLAAKSDADGAGGPGWLEGYASTWDNIDQANETMIRGCFARSVKESIPAGKVKLMARHIAHGGDAMECIGTVVEAREDDHGLWIKAEFASTEDAQSIRVKIMEGHVKGLSVGFFPVRWEERNNAAQGGIPPAPPSLVAHLECQLLEVTTTVFPCNEQAGITSVKSNTPATPAVVQATGTRSPGSIAPAPAAKASPPLDLPRAKRELELRRAELFLLAE